LALGELFGVKQVYWAVLTAVIVMQASVGGSLKATIDRLAGTAAGALGTAFGLQQLVRNLADLTERVSELTAGR
jgi:uncharacterized membrane protein YgaE (UPF0421/DUF939 family)